MAEEKPKNIVFQAVIEVLGKPKEHVEKNIKGYVDKLKGETERYEVVSSEFAELKQQEDQEAWSTFVELEVKTAIVEDITAFCFDYMPSLIEVIEPKELAFKDNDLSNFLNDLQAKLHRVDMIAKQVKMDNDHLRLNMAYLLKNYVMVLLSKKALTSEQLSSLIGIKQDKLEDYLDMMIDEGKIDLKGDTYYRKDIEYSTAVTDGTETNSD